MNLKLNCHHTCCTDNKIKVMVYNKNVRIVRKKNKSNLLEHDFTHVNTTLNCNKTATSKNNNFQFNKYHKTRN